MATAIHSVLYTQDKCSLPSHCQKAHYDKHYEKDNWKEIIIYNTSTATTAVGGYHLDYPIAYIYIHMYHSMLAC